MDNIIKTVNLEKIYGKSSVKTHALKGVNLDIPRGTFACIIGPSGHGKSTLLQLIGGLDRPTKGDAYIDGENNATLNKRELADVRAKKIGFVFQFFNLLPNLTALENIQTAMMFGKMSSGEQKEKAQTLLNMVGLAEKADAKPSELSGGQQQRISIARALANDPDILLMDEPTGNLDSESEKEVLEQIQKIHQAGKTIVMVTHSHDIANTAEQIITIRDGVIA